MSSEPTQETNNDRIDPVIPHSEETPKRKCRAKGEPKPPKESKVPKPKKAKGKAGRPPKLKPLSMQRNARDGRPTAKLPDVWKPAVKDMANKGKEIDEIRSILIASGIEATRESIRHAMYGDQTRIDEIDKLNKNPGLRGLSSPLFDDFRDVVDDFIAEGRTITRIRAYLMVEHFVVTTEDVEEYVEKRKAELAVEASSTPYQAAQKKQYMHVRMLRLRLAEIWHNMPPEKRYSDRMFAVVLSEYGSALHDELKRLKVEQETDKPSNEAANAEIEQKLGIVEAEIAEEEAQALPIDPQIDDRVPVAADPAMKATV